jgi:hypothetical protein
MGGEGGQPRGEGKGRPCVWGEKEGGDQEGQKGERATTRVSLWEKRNDATDDSDLASNGPQPFFPHPRTEDLPLATFFGILQAQSKIGESNTHKTQICSTTTHISHDLSSKHNTRSSQLKRSSNHKRRESNAWSQSQGVLECFL